MEGRGYSDIAQEEDQTDCGNYRGISLVAHAGKVILKIVAFRLGSYLERERLLPESQCGFRPGRSTVDMMFVVRRLQELGRKEGVPLYTCFGYLQKACDSVDRSFLWVVLARFGVPPEMVDIVRQFHDEVPACVRLNGGRVSEWFEIGQGLRQGCVLNPIFFNIFFTAVLNTAEERLRADPQVEADLVSTRSNPLAVRGGDETPRTSTI